MFVNIHNLEEHRMVLLASRERMVCYHHLAVVLMLTPFMPSSSASVNNCLSSVTLHP